MRCHSFSRKHILLSALCLAAPALADDSIYSAGVAKIDITPGYPIRLCGYRTRQKESEGVEQKLWARALALGQDNSLCIVVAVDNIGVPRGVVEEVAERLRRRIALPRERLTVSSTHIHSGPCLTGVLPNMFATDLPSDHQTHIDRYTRELTDAIEKVALDATAARRPARLAWGQGNVTFAANRRTKGGPVDHAMPLLRISDPDGKLRGIWVNYACHCTSVGAETNVICGDWAGYAAQNIDAAHPGVVTLVTIGCGGDANPEPRPGLQYAQQHGRALADEADRVLESELIPLSGKLTCQLRNFDIPFDPPPTREQVTKIARQDDWIGYHARKDLARLNRGEKLEATLPYYVQTWTFSDQLAIVFLSGEAVVDYSRRLKNEFDAKRLWVNAYSNDVPCYIPSRRVLAEGGYEAELAMHYYDHPARLAPAVEGLIVRTVHDLLPDSFRTPEQRATYPAPLSPEQALDSFKLPQDLRIELVAAEPLVVDPVAIDWGANGKLWVVEMRDYPTGLNENGTPGGRIKYLEDMDGDGRYDRAQLFLDGLHYPDGVLHWGKGILVCAAPELIYAEDTDGDGKADVKKVLLSGFSTPNPQHLFNGLQLGLDGWLYGANVVKQTPVTITASGRRVDLGSRDFRFRPDTDEFEPAAGQTQYGRAHDDYDNWFGCDNSNWLWHFPLPEHYLRRNPYVPSPNPRLYVPREPDSDHIYPISRTLERPNDPERANRTTSACSPLIYTDDLLGKGYTGNAFTCEVVHNVVHRLVLEPDGVTFKGHRHPSERQSEFLASFDNWFRPAQIRIGPDGAIWVVDMYRFVIEHPEWISAEQLARLDLRAGEDQGRIYRIVPRNRAARTVPAIAHHCVEELVKALNSTSRTLRDLVQQELIERNARDAVEPLRRLIAETPHAAVRVQALHILHQLGGLRVADIVPALSDRDANVREHAVQLSEPFLNTDHEVLQTVLTLVDDPEIRVRYQVALSLGEASGDRAAGALARIAVHDLGDDWMRAAVLSSAGNAADRVLTRVITAQPSPARDEMIGRLVATAAANGHPQALQNIIGLLASSSGNPEPWRLAATAAVLDARERTKVALDLSPVRALFDTARSWVASDQISEANQLVAIPLLARGSDHDDQDLTTLAGLFSPRTPWPIQSAVVSALGKLRQSRVSEVILDGWASASPVLRSSMLDVLLSRADWIGALLSAVHAGRIRPAEIDAMHREQLLRHGDASVRAVATKLLATVQPSSRKSAIDRFRSVVTLKGQAAAGEPIFAKLCASCHALRGMGHEVGPNLAALTDRSTEYLLKSILDPNAAVEAKYTNYIVGLTDGRTLSGLITEETGSSLGVLQGNGVRDAILRSDVTELQSSNSSMMPEGLEEGLTPQQMADLIAFIQNGPSLLGSSSPAQVEGARKALRAEGVNGLVKIMSATEHTTYPGWLGSLPLHVCRQMDGKWAVTWLTAPVPLSLKADTYHTFRLASAMGYMAEPAGSFTLLLNPPQARGAVSFEVTLGDRTWQSDDTLVRLHYKVMQSNTQDSTGVLTIDVHASLLRPGEPVVFQVVGSASKSQRWFGVYDFHG